MKINNYEIRNENENTAELLLYGIIGDYWDELDAKDIVEDLRKIEASQIIVRIYSDGGSVFAGLAIYNALKSHPANILVKIDSLAASIASIIAMAGTVEMPENAFMMIHNPWGSIYGGDSKDMEQMAKVLAKIKDSLITVYKNKTGLENDKISDLMDAESWFMAKEAIELGFADKITGTSDPKNMKVFNQLKNYKNVPDQLKNMIDKSAPEDGAKQKPSIKGDEVMEITMAVLEKDAPALLEKIQADAKQEGAELGATNERDRIKGVSDQNMVGHEALVSGLMYDGKTTGPEAAVQVLAAEKVIRGTAATNLAADGVKPVVAIVPADDGKKTIDPELPLDEQAKLTWDGDKALRNEFQSDFDSFKAYFEANKGGHVRILKSKREA